MSLDDLLRETAARGELNYISLIPVRNGWSAVYAPASRCSHNIAMDADPAEAIRKAITGAKRRKTKIEDDAFFG